MEIKTKERKLIYYPIEKDEIIERNLDDFILFMMSGKFRFRNDICSFFGISNTTYFPPENESGSDYPHINSHCAEKNNLLKELVEDELIIPKSSKTYYLHPDLVDDNVQDKIDTVTALHIINDIAHGKKVYFSLISRMLTTTCVVSGNFINWHTNKFYPDATVDKLKELGLKKFYELNKDNIVKKREYFRNKDKIIGETKDVGSNPTTSASMN